MINESLENHGTALQILCFFFFFTFLFQKTLQLPNVFGMSQADLQTTLGDTQGLWNVWSYLLLASVRINLDKNV